MDNFYRDLILFIVGSLLFAFGLIFALRGFAKINIKTRWKVASLFGLTGVALGFYRMSELMTLLKIIAYSLPLACLTCILVYKYKDKLNKLPDGLYELTMGLLIICSPWLQATNFILYGVLGFTVVLTGIYISFALEEKYLKLPSR